MTLIRAVSALTHDVGEEELGGVLAVVPVSVVDPLSQQLDGRLCAVLLLGRHVQVVDKHDALLAQRRSVHAFATSSVSHTHTHRNRSSGRSNF